MKIFTLILFCILTVAIFAQNNSGEIKFQESIKLQIDLPEGNEELRKSIPTSQTLRKALLFSGDETYYKDDAPNEDVEINHAEDGAQMQIVMKNPENNIYTNRDKNELIQSTEFFGKYFLINGNLKNKKWKVTGDQKQILDYTCQKAVLLDTLQSVIAWFTTQIPVPAGPNGYCNLPGMILSIETDKGDRIITATKVEFRSLKEGEIIKPIKGKKVSVEEFNKIRDEKMKEMGMIHGKGGAVKMIIREER